MFKTLTLNNFRSIESETTSFEQGLNVFRGKNEAGKSTRLEAIAYALVGTSALRTSLEGAVTYGKAVGSLKVTLVFTVDSIDYVITRGKSGAELVYDGGTVTGQTETKFFIERLLGVSAAMSTKLLFANQSEVKGILAQGGTAASALIETLADLGQIEILIEKIQAQLPCGNTSALSGQLEALEESLKQPMPDAPNDAPVASAAARVEVLEVETARTEKSVQLLRDESKTARTKLAEIDTIESDNARTERRRADYLAVPMPEAPLESRETLALWVQQEAALGGAKALYAASRVVYQDSASYFEGTREEFFAAVESLKVHNADLVAQQSSIKVQTATARALLINETTCGFCKKDLSSVPEVVAANSAAHTKLQALVRELEEVEVSAIAARTSGKTYDAWATEDRKIMASLGKYWEASDTMPCKPIWVHGEVPEPASKADAIKELTAAYKSYDKALYDFESAKEALAALEILPVPPRDIWETCLAALPEAEKMLRESQQGLSAAKVAHAEAAGEYKAEVARYDATLAEAARAKTQIETLKAQIAQMGKINELVKKLRTARPIIASKLWDTVLGAVSYYFSQVRGVTSTVSRTVKGFEVDGQELDGLSGSTQDALGLALRLALVKTFIPNAAFMSLDEPASGCDEQRELAMLGVIAASGFEQVLLVTHSDLADSFAANVVAV